MPFGKTQPLEVIGSFESDITISKITERIIFYVIKNGTDLLSKITVKILGVLCMGLEINAINHFQNSKTSSLTSPSILALNQPYRRIPILLETKMNNKIRKLIESDIIEEVNEPSRWVSSMVPVLKENGEIRICIDMRRANTAII